MSITAKLSSFCQLPHKKKLQVIREMLAILKGETEDFASIYSQVQSEDLDDALLEMIYGQILQLSEEGHSEQMKKSQEKILQVQQYMKNMVAKEQEEKEREVDQITTLLN